VRPGPDAGSVGQMGMPWLLCSSSGSRPRPAGWPRPTSSSRSDSPPPGRSVRGYARLRARSRTGGGHTAGAGCRGSGQFAGAARARARPRRPRCSSAHCRRRPEAPRHRFGGAGGGLAGGQPLPAFSQRRAGGLWPHGSCCRARARALSCWPAAGLSLTHRPWGQWVASSDRSSRRQLVTGVDEELGGVDSAELVAQRDAVLTALLAAKARVKLPGGTIHTAGARPMTGGVGSARALTYPPERYLRVATDRPARLRGAGCPDRLIPHQVIRRGRCLPHDVKHR